MAEPVIARSIAELSQLMAAQDEALEILRAEIELHKQRLFDSVRPVFERQAAVIEKHFAAAGGTVTKLEAMFSMLGALHEWVESDPQRFEEWTQALAGALDHADKALELLPAGSERQSLKRTRAKLAALLAKGVAHDRRHKPRERPLELPKPSCHVALIGLNSHAPPLRERALASITGGAA